MLRARPHRPGPLTGLVLVVLLAHGVLLGGLSVSTVGVAPGPLPSPAQVRLVAPPPAPVSAPPRAPVRRSPPQAKAVPTTTPATDDAASPAAMAPPVAAAPVPEPDAAAAEVASATPSPTEAAPTPAGPLADFQWPTVGPEHWPPSMRLDYRLTGQDKGLNYHAQGQLRWQHNGQDYALSLTVRAFLLGSREWRSVGQIGPQGLRPRRFSDHGRQERAAHFEHEQVQLVFSGATTPVPLAPGAQDQLSLYVQLAAAMLAAPQEVQGASPFRVQTATARNLVPWVLTHQGQEVLQHEGRRWVVQRWLCEPQSRWDARLELWSAPELGGLPLRIRITQVSGSFIDLWWVSSAPLPPWAPNS